MVAYLHESWREKKALKCFESKEDHFRVKDLLALLETVFSELNDEIVSVIDDARSNRRQYLTQPRFGIVPEFSVKLNTISLRVLSEMQDPYLSLPVELDDGSCVRCNVSLSYAEVKNEGRLFSDDPEIHANAVVCIRIEDMSIEVGEDVEFIDFIKR